MTLYVYSTGEAVRDLTEAEAVVYFQLLMGLPSSQQDVGAVPGEAFGVDCAVFAM